MKTVELKVEVPGKPYSVWVGAGLLERASELLPLPDRLECAFIAADEHADSAYGERAYAGLSAACLRVERERIAGGEGAKSLDTAERMWNLLIQKGFHRGDLIVGLGGGATGDLAGFIASTYHRGVAFAQMPTTLLAMVDASIGGKTAINLPAGKNLVGAFHQPIGVIADVTTLATLPKEEFASGMAEVVKHGLISDPEILGMVSETSNDAALIRLVAKAAAVKTGIVAEDETEHGARAFLNYGHTLGHALESLGGYTRWRHGEAVALGMMFAAHLARDLGYADRVAEHTRAIEEVALPTRGATEGFDDVLAAMGADKKFDHGVRFVVLEDIGSPVVVRDVPEDALRRAYEAVRA